MHPGAVATAFSAYIVDQNPGMGLKEFFTDDPKLNAWTQGKSERHHQAK